MTDAAAREPEREKKATHKLAWDWVIEHHTSDGRSLHDGEFKIHAQTAVKWMAEFGETLRADHVRERERLIAENKRLGHENAGNLLLIDMLRKPDPELVAQLSAADARIASLSEQLGKLRDEMQKVLPDHCGSLMVEGAYVGLQYRIKKWAAILADLVKKEQA